MVQKMKLNTGQVLPDVPVPKVQLLLRLELLSLPLLPLPTFSCIPFCPPTTLNLLTRAGALALPGKQRKLEIES